MTNKEIKTKLKLIEDIQKLENKIEIKKNKVKSYHDNAWYTVNLLRQQLKDLKIKFHEKVKDENNK
jgi:hypothetical protein